MAELFHWAPQERAAKSTFGDVTLQAKNPISYQYSSQELGGRMKSYKESDLSGK